MDWLSFSNFRWLRNLVSQHVNQQSKYDDYKKKFPNATIHREASVSGNVELQDGVSLRKGVAISGNVSIGRGTFCNGPTSIRSGHSQIKIGAFCSIAANVALTTGDHPISNPSSYFTNSGQFSRPFSDVAIDLSPINIGNDVWIARGCTILKNTNIGHGAIVAAGAVVTSDIPPYSIVGGVPAKLIRKRFSDETIEWLLAIEWWNWANEELIARKGFFSTDLAQLEPEQLRRLGTELGITY